MTELIHVTEEAQLTDSKGWLYRNDEHRPFSLIPQLMNTIYEAELGEELDWTDCLKLAVYIDSEMSFGQSLNNDDLIKFWEDCQDVYQGDFSSEADFAEDFFISTGQLDEEATKWLVIDWQGTYNYALRYDYWNAYIYARNEQTNEIEVCRFFFRNQ